MLCNSHQAKGSRFLGDVPRTMTVETYKTYLQALRASPLDGKMMPYNWADLRKPVSARWLVYSQMLDEFARELANSVNKLTTNVQKLSDWAAVLQDADEEKQFEIAHEFIDDLATNTLMLPYVIKSRFAFSIAHLSHQANRVWSNNWKDDLALDAAIYLDATDARAPHWQSYKKLKLSVEAINGRSFKAATGDFRNAYNHRFSPRFVFGVTQIVTRTVDEATGRINYGIGGRPPLQLKALVELLDKERNRCYIAFERFQILINEQISAIADSQARLSDAHR